jgi:hypothetical protein
VQPTATAPLDNDWVCAWQEEMRRAVGRCESLPPAACGAIARLLERFLDEETAERGRAEEIRLAIALLRESSQRNGFISSSGRLSAVPGFPGTHSRSPPRTRGPAE